MKRRKSLDVFEIFKPAKTTGALIKAFRKNFEISQTDMAAALGIPQGNLSQIENNRREVGPSVALRLSAVLGLSPEIIMYPRGYESEPEYKRARDRSAAILPMTAKSRA